MLHPLLCRSGSRRCHLLHGSVHFVHGFGQVIQCLQRSVQFLDLILGCQKGQGKILQRFNQSFEEQDQVDQYGYLVTT